MSVYLTPDSGRLVDSILGGRRRPEAVGHIFRIGAVKMLTLVLGIVVSAAIIWK